MGRAGIEPATLWADVDLDLGWWTIPPEHSKNSRPHRVPLVPDVVTIIKAQQQMARSGAVMSSRDAVMRLSREYISAVLNHVQGGPAATRVYDRYSRDREKRAALEAWARTLQQILAEPGSAAVVPFRRRAARRP